MVESSNITQELQNKVDKIKTLSLISNAHNLTPPKQKENLDENNIAIVKALDNYPKIQEIYLEAQGLMYDEKEKKLISVSEKIMNREGAYLLQSLLKRIILSDWSNYPEDIIPKMLDYFMSDMLPSFTIWHDYYELEPRNFTYVKSTLGLFMLASFYKARTGKMLNLLGRTYSEDLLGRVMNLNNEKQKQKEKGGFLDTINPFKKKF